MKSFVRAASCLVALACLAGCESTPEKGDVAKDARGDTSTTTAADARTLIPVLSPFPGWPRDGAGVRKGLWVKSSATGAYSSETLWSIVDESGEVVKLEYQNLETQGYYLALVVNKKDGKVTKALAGKKGEKLVPIKITDMKPAPAPTAPEQTTTDEDVTIAAGIYHAKKTVTQSLLADYTTWTGVDGDVVGVMLKTQVDNEGRELKVAPSFDDVMMGGKSYKARHLVYTNGEESWTINDPGLTIPFATVNGATPVKQIAGGTTTVNAWGDDARPLLSWEE